MHRLGNGVEQLHLVDLAVAAHRGDDELPGVGLVDEGLDEALGRQTEEVRDLGDRGLARSLATLERRRRGDGIGRPGAPLGLLLVGAVTAGRAVDDRALAGRGGDHELVRRRAADRAGVGLDHGVVEPAGLEDPPVGRTHRLVGFVETLRGGVERVGVLHQELAAAHQAETRADLVAELGLDLVEIERQLAVALDVAPHDVGDHLFVGRSETEVALVAVADAQQLLAVLLPAPGLEPELGGLDRRHRELDGAGGVHLATDDRHQLLEAAPAGRQVGVDPRGELLDHPGAHHELVGDDLGVVRDLARRVQVVTAPAVHRFGRLLTRSSRRAESFRHSIILSSSAPTRGSRLRARPNAARACSSSPAASNAMPR